MYFACSISIIMRSYLSFAATLLLFFSARAQQPGLSPLTRQYLALKASGSITAGQCLMLKKNGEGIPLAGAIIKVSDPAKAAAGLSRLGIHVNTKAGTVWTIKVPEDLIGALVKTEGIAYIQLDEPVKPNLNIVRTNTRTDSVYQGLNLPASYSGKGVIVGVIDFGFDYQHPACYDTLGSRYRIKRIWELNSNGTPPQGYNYGHEITDTVQMKARGTDNAEQTHGAMVAGVAAGSGFGSTGHNRYRGIAYDADLVFVGVRRDSIGEQWLTGGFSDFLDGISYIFRYASSVNKPCVVNISWGSQSGPHDGSTLFNEACDNLSDAGKIIVMSAGNDGQEKIHLSKTFTPSDTLLETFLDFVPASYKRTWIDAWGDTGMTFCAEVSLFSNGVETASSGFFCIDNQVHDTFLLNTLSGDSCTLQFITSAAEYNGKPRLTINLFNHTPDTVLVRIKSTDGRVHLWNEYYYYGYTNGYISDFSSFGYPFATEGNTESTTSDMGSAASVLLVGAHISKKNWRSISGDFLGYGSTYIVNNIAPFSSRGPLTNGQSKPDFTAPGLTMATSSNSFETRYSASGSRSSYVVSSYTDPASNRTFYYAEFTGTSASAPVASGIIALMLEANPTMSPSQVKTIIRQTAITDTYTGTIPPGGDNTWGYGKINAYAAVKRATQETGLYSFSGSRLDAVLFPNPNKGRFTIDYTALKNEALSVEVYDTRGVQVIRHPGLGVSAGHYLIPLDISAFGKGLYFIRISNGEGSAVIRTLVE